MALPPPVTMITKVIPPFASGTLASTVVSFRNLKSTFAEDAELNVTLWKHSLVPKFSPLMTTRSPGLASSGSTLLILGRLLRSQTGSFAILDSSTPLMDSVSNRLNPEP